MIMKTITVKIYMQRNLSISLPDVNRNQEIPSKQI